MFSPALKQNGKAIKSARNMVRELLAEKGFNNKDAAQMLIQIGLADRPASVAIFVGEDDEAVPIASEKERKPLQSCRDREHRLNITMIDQTNGTILYAGAASEYHCNGKIEASLPHLVKAALSGMDTVPSETARITVQERRGLE